MIVGENKQAMTIQQENTFEGVVIDATTKEPIDKDYLIKILKNHRVNTTTIEDSNTRLEDAIPALRKAKINLPETFYKDLSQKLYMPYVENKNQKNYEEEQRSKLIPSYLQPLCLFNLIVGNLSYIAIYVVACVKLKKNRYIPYALAMPAYWALLSFASWRGFIQLIKNPFYWDKTSHGVSKVATAK